MPLRKGVRLQTPIGIHRAQQFFFFSLSPLLGPRTKQRIVIYPAVESHRIPTPRTNCAPRTDKQNSALAATEGVLQNKGGEDGRGRINETGER